MSKTRKEMSQVTAEIDRKKRNGKLTKTYGNTGGG